MKNTYAITGGTGYIGSKLIEHLSNDKDNFIYAIIRESSTPKILRNNVCYVIYDGTEKSLEQALSLSDYLIHLGALYTTSNDETSTINLINSNIIFSTQLFNVAQRLNPNLVITSASTFSFLDGDGNYEPATLYATTKKAVEDIAHYYKDLSIHFLTFPDTYGPDDWRPKIHNILAKNNSWPFEFRSPGEQEMRLMHVEDIIGHLLSSLNNGEKGVHIHDIYAEGILVNLRELSKLITDKECLFNDNGVIVEIPKKAREISKKTGWMNKHKTFNL